VSTYIVPREKSAPCDAAFRKKFFDYLLDLHLNTFHSPALLPKYATGAPNAVAAETFHPACKLSNSQ